MNVIPCRWLVGGALAAGLSAQTFGAVVSTPVPGLSVWAIGLCDADGDGRLDVVAAPRGDSVVRSLLGDGAGGFAAIVASSLVYGVPADAAAFLDATGDGVVDAIVSGGVINAGVRVMQGDGSGAFVQGPPIAGMPLLFHGMNLDGDQYPDLVGIAAFSSVLTVAFGAPGGGFLPPVSVATGVAVPPVVFELLSEDVDGDGDEDLLPGGLPASAVLLSDGAGGFAGGSQLPPLATRPQALGDFDGDARLDLLAADVSGVVRLFRNDGLGGFLPPGPALSGPNPNLRGVRAADVDLDGATDALIASATSIQLWLGDGAGGLTASQTIEVVTIDDFQVGDLDADGRVEIVVAGANVVQVVRQYHSVPTGLVGYGLGTPTCRGTIGITGSGLPRRGSSEFRVLCTNVPTDAGGLLLAGTKVVGGWDPLGIQLRLHLGFLFPVGAMHSDLAGVASRALALPSAPWFVGFQVHLQSVWMADAGSGDTCSPALYELASSRGLTITIQP